MTTLDVLLTVWAVLIIVLTTLELVFHPIDKARRRRLDNKRPSPDDVQYDNERAATVIHEFLNSRSGARDFSRHDILTFIDARDEFRDRGPYSPMSDGITRMGSYQQFVDFLDTRGLHLSHVDVEQFQEGEMLYLKELGLWR